MLYTGKAASSNAMTATNITDYLTFFDNYQAPRISFPKDDAEKHRVKQHVLTGGIGGTMTNGSGHTSNGVITRDLLALDFDSIPDEAAFLTQVAAWATRADIGYVLYKTYTYTPTAPRYRLLVPLSKGLHESSWRQLMQGTARALGEELDPAALTWAQLFFLPVETEKHGSNLIHVHHGKPLNVDSIQYVPTKRPIPSSYSPTSRKGVSLFERIAAGATTGERNTWLASIIGSLIRAGVTKPAVMIEWVDVINQNFIHPPLPDAEAETVLKHIWNAELKRRTNANAH